MPQHKQPSNIPPQLKRIARFVKLMDSEFRIPGTRLTFGLDPLIGLVPILGDLIDYGISALLLIAMVQNGASGQAIAKMILNITIDGVIGLVPVAGRIFDVFYKANDKNLKLAVSHFGEGKYKRGAGAVIIPL